MCMFDSPVLCKEIKKEGQRNAPRQGQDEKEDRERYPDQSGGTGEGKNRAVSHVC